MKLPSSSNRHIDGGVAFCRAVGYHVSEDQVQERGFKESGLKT